MPLAHDLITAESLAQYAVVFQSLIFSDLAVSVILGLCYSGIPSF